MGPEVAGSSASAVDKSDFWLLFWRARRYGRVNKKTPWHYQGVSAC
jgi:hypothetical protein